MTSHSSPNPSGSGDQDPWAAFGYLVAGVVFYGALGFVLGRWLHAAWLVPVGIVVGVLAGMYMVFARYRFRDDAPVTDAPTTDALPPSGSPTATPNPTPAPTTPDERPSAEQTAPDDRGATQ